MKLNPYTTSLFIILAVFVMGCKNRKEKPVNDIPPKAIQLPAIPPMINSENDRLNFLINHYWDSMDFTDTTYIHYPNITEQAIANYLDLLNINADRNQVDSSLDKLFSKLESEKSGKIIRYFTETMSRYLYEPNSPTRNENTYILFAERMIKSNHIGLNEADRVRARFNIEMANKNKQGSVASDFSYISLSGESGTLHKLTSPYTILFFYDPECTICKKQEQSLSSNSIISKWIRNNSLEILAICIDNKFEKWKSDAEHLPSEWIVAFDMKQEITKKTLYFIEATPSIYLLDKDKKVILKDTSLGMLFQWLEAKEENI